MDVYPSRMEDNNQTKMNIQEKKRSAKFILHYTPDFNAGSPYFARLIFLLSRQPGEVRTKK